MTPSSMINYLVSKGYTEVRIAESVGVSQPSVHRIKVGRGTTYETGKKIERLYFLEGGTIGLPA